MDCGAVPKSLYGRRKITAHLRRQGLPVAYYTVDRLMRAEGVNGVGQRQERAHHGTG